MSRGRARPLALAEIAEALSDMIDLADAWASSGPEGYTAAERKRRKPRRSRAHASLPADRGRGEGAMIAWNPEDPVATWLLLGQANRWIRQAWDPPFTRASFTRCAHAADLKFFLAHGNWSLGSAFYIGELGFIEQTGGGDEWLVIKQNVAVESVSAAAMIEAGTFDEFLERVLVASPYACAKLCY
jgi:hypothetical protein